MKPGGVNVASYSQLWEDYYTANLTFDSKDMLLYPTISAYVSENNTLERGFQEDATLIIDFEHEIIRRLIKVKYVRSF